jgi:predicted Zn finger-like uncharacterized protein
MILQCPTCAAAIEVPDETLGAKATLTCPACGRVVVARDAQVAPPIVGEVTMPFTPPQAPPSGEQTLVSGRGPSLSLPRHGRVSLAFLSGPRNGDVVVLTRPRVVLGRTGSGADIEVADAEVSRRHAALECYGDTFVLKDEGSRNGTWVGTQRVEVARIEVQSEFRIGTTRCLLIVTDE